MKEIQNRRRFLHLIAFVGVLNFALFSCNNPKERLLIGHSWAVNSISYKNNIIFSHSSNNTFVVSNIIVFKKNDFIRMPWITNATPNNGYWETISSPNHSAPIIKISQLPYDDFNGIYTVDIIKKNNGLIFLTLKSDEYTFKCSTAI